ncbi:MAG: A/G-specific adenine glycosylase, partial [Terriglobia bacterium]
MKANPDTPGGKLQAKPIRRALLKWYRAHARELPWRKTRDPYPVWVSEVMLQQTQITTVRPYYLRFLRAFPTVRHLACAPFERVAEQWSGLGYYRRARYLHLAAQKLVKESKGRFPSEYSAARELPGVGHYTACAVLSIAYNRPLAVMDGNVARVIARVAALPGHLQQARFKQVAEKIAQELLSPAEPGLFNQAMMELGQTICLPRAPRCQVCPVRPWCRAHQQGQPESYPAPRPRRVVEKRHLAVAIIRKGKRV